MQMRSGGELAMDLVFDARGDVIRRVTTPHGNGSVVTHSPLSERVSRWASSLVLASSTALGPPRRCATSSGAPLVENVTQPGWQRTILTFAGFTTDAAVVNASVFAPPACFD